MALKWPFVCYMRLRNYSLNYLGYRVSMYLFKKIRLDITCVAKLAYRRITLGLLIVEKIESVFLEKIR